MKQQSINELERKQHSELPQEFKETEEKVLRENSNHNAENIIEKITNRHQTLTTKYIEIVKEINKLKAINLTLDIERRELAEAGHSFVNNQRMREIFVVQMNNQCSIGMNNHHSIEELECVAESTKKEIEYIEQQLDSLIILEDRLPSPTTYSTQQQREQVLIKLLNELKAQHPDLNLQLLPYDKETIFQMLKDKNPVLFTDGILEDFWKNKPKGVCKLKRGKKSE